MNKPHLCRSDLPNSNMAQLSTVMLRLAGTGKTSLPAWSPANWDFSMTSAKVGPLKEVNAGPTWNPQTLKVLQSHCTLQLFDYKVIHRYLVQKWHFLPTAGENSMSTLTCVEMGGISLSLLKLKPTKVCRCRANMCTLFDPAFPMFNTLQVWYFTTSIPEDSQSNPASIRAGS